LEISHIVDIYGLLHVFPSPLSLCVSVCCLFLASLFTFFFKESFLQAFLVHTFLHSIEVSRQKLDHY
jgi:hypothetical protein